MWFGLNSLDYTLWLSNIFATFLLLVVLVKGNHYQDAIFIRGKMLKSLSPFSAYVCFCLLRSLVLFTVKQIGKPSDYYIVYYGAVFVGAVLLVLTAMEVAWEVFGPYHTIPVRAVVNLCGAIIVMSILLFALSELYGFHPPQRYWDLVLIIDRFLLSVCFGGLALSVYFAYALNLPWNHKAKSICAGVMFFTFVQAVNQYFTVLGPQARFHRPYGMLAFFVAQIFWIYEFRKPARPVTEVTDAFINALQQSLEQIGNGKRVPTVT